MKEIKIILSLFILQFLTIIQVQSTSTCKHPEELTQTLVSCMRKKKVLIFTTSDQGYDYDRLNYQWNTRLGNIQPLAIATPASVKDVQHVIKCVRESGKIRVVARSGGHWYENTSYATGFHSLTDEAKRDAEGSKVGVPVPVPDHDTIVIDLGRLDEISVDQRTRTAEVGSGVLLGQLYWKIWNNGGFCFPAGTNPTLGAGQTLGGGFGVLSKRFGMSLDNVLEMEMVDADGNVQTANAVQNPNLFWALRGAGAGNFGIVTKFKYQLHNVSQHVFVKIKYTFHPKEVTKVIQVWNSLVDQSQSEPTAYTLLTYSRDELAVTLIDFDSSQPDTIVAIIEKQLSPDSVTVKHQNFIELMTDLSDEYPLSQPSDLANVTTHDLTPEVFLAKSYYSNKVLSSVELNALIAVLTRIPKHILVQFNVYGGTVNSKTSDSTSFVHRNALQEISVRVFHESPGEQEWITQFNMVALSTIDNGESYQNLVDGRLDDSLLRFYGKNLDRLIEVKRLVDPHNFFNFPKSIPIELNGFGV